MRKNCMRIVQLNMIFLELISSAKDNNVTLRIATTYKIYISLTIFIVYKHFLTFKNNSVNNLNCIEPLHHNEIKYQGEVIPILCTIVGAHGLQREVEFSNFLALQISNAVSQTLDSNSLLFQAHTLHSINHIFSIKSIYETRQKRCTKRTTND